VLVRRRGDDSFLCYGADYCKSAIERFVWDGEQILYELRAPGGASDPLDDIPPYTGDDTKYGWVGYTHGPGLDAPLDLFRMDFADTTRVTLPHTNWRGAYDAGTDTTGTVLTEWDIQFPASYRNAFHSDPEAPFRDLPDWFGSLIQDKADESGLIYMRNRYYDPATGRFTQEDPIGLAGGLNLYGFAGGDPINFWDPFGLCLEDDEVCADLVRQLRAQEGSEFHKAADAFDEYTGGRVSWVAGDNGLLNVNGTNTDGDPESWTGGIKLASGDVLLNAGFSGADRLLTAVHEGYHLTGASETGLVNAEYRAFKQLPENYQRSAVRHLDRFFHKLNTGSGHPLRLVEPRKPWP